MLADQLDYVVGVDPHRDSHALAVVQVVSGAVVFEATVVASSDGYAQALKLADQHAPGRRAFAVEGTGSFGAGLTRFLTGRGERVLEVSRLRRERRSGGKTDALDAVRAARSVLTSERPATPRAGGERQALQALVAAREGAVNAKRAGLCQLRDLLITTPEPLRSELRPLTRARLLQRLAATRPGGGRDPELRGSTARAALDRPTRAAADRRGTRARTRDRNAHAQARAAAARPARRRTARRRATRALLVTPRTDQLRSSLRTARRRSTDPGLLRPDDPLPPRPKRRPQTQPRAAHDPRHTQTLTPRRRSPTSNDASKKARHDAKQTAASSATSPATSTGYSNTDRHWRLDRHRSITRVTHASVAWLAGQRIPAPAIPRRIRSPLTRPAAAGISSARGGRVSGFRVEGSRLPSVPAPGRRPTRWCRVTFRAARRRPRGREPRRP